MGRECAQLEVATKQQSVASDGYTGGVKCGKQPGKLELRKDSA